MSNPKFQSIINTLLREREATRREIKELSEVEAQMDKMLAECGYVEEVVENDRVVDDELPYAEAVNTVTNETTTTTY